MKTQALLIRTPTTDDHSLDPYHAPLASLFAQPPSHLALLTTAHTATAQLVTLLSAPPQHDAIVLTSARSAQALALALAEVEAVGSGWSDVVWFVVGRATRDALLALEHQSAQGSRWSIDPDQVLGEETGSADVLGPFILAHYAARNAGSSRTGDCDAAPTASQPTQRAKLLLLTGDKNRDTLTQKLTSPSTSLSHLLVYSTGVSPTFAPSFTSQLAHIADSSVKRLWIVLFSPSGAQAVVPLLRELKPSGVDVRLAAIGPTTRDWLEEQGGDGVRCDAMASSPDPQGLREALREAEERLERIE